MGFASNFSLIAFGLIMIILIFYFCHWAHRKRRIEETVFSSSTSIHSSSGNARNRSVPRRTTGGGVYTIPYNRNNTTGWNMNSRMGGGIVGRGRMTSTPQIVVVTLTPTPQMQAFEEELPPPSYEEVTQERCVVVPREHSSG